MELSVRRLSFPAPRRYAVTTSHEKYCTAPYTVMDVVNTVAGGGYFIPGQHEFQDADARDLAIALCNEYKEV